MIPSGSKVLLACSGGLDSSVLFHLLLNANIPFSVAHVDHLTREGDSTADAGFVQKLCNTYNIVYHLYQLSHPEENNVNFQSLAHDKRYAFFQSLAYDIVLTAHHQDDIVESIFLNFVQGRSLGGIYEQLGNVVRPLLPFNRSEISNYAFENDIPFVEDYSNFENEYDRNFIRNEILPLLQSRFDNLSKRIIGLSDIYADQQKLLKEVYKVKKNKEGRYNILKETVLNSATPTSMLYSSLQSFGFSRKQCGEVFKALESVGAQLESSGYILTIDRAHIFIDAISKSESIITLDYRTENRISYGQIEFSFKIIDQATHLKEEQYAYFPVHKLNPTLTLRHWQDGDRFKPFGMAGHTQSLKKYFTDHKIDLKTKRDIPLLLNGNDIIWVVPYRTHQDYAIRPNEGPFLEVRCNRTVD